MLRKRKEARRKLWHGVDVHLSRSQQEQSDEEEVVWQRWCGGSEGGMGVVNWHSIEGEVSCNKS